MEDLQPARDPANESMRSFYSTKSTGTNNDEEDIMVIDVTGNQEALQTPKVKRKKAPATEEGPPTTTIKKKKSSAHSSSRSAGQTVFQPVVSTTRFDQVGGNEKSLKVALKWSSTLPGSFLFISVRLLQEVRKLILHMKHPEVYAHLGLAPPRGFLLHGPPGCGKTLLAHAIAGELEVPMFKVAAPELVSGVSGESEEQIRGLFSQAAQSAPCVVFIDEIDAITPKRETAQREMERRIVAQLLSCLDDLGRDGSGSGVLVIGATNRPDSLDPALRRAGRFDREVCLGIPDGPAREKILQVVCKGLQLDADVLDGWKTLAALTPGYVGADMLALAAEAGMLAVNRAFQLIMTETARKEEEPEEKQPPKTEEERWMWLCRQPAFDSEQLATVRIGLDDFRTALKSVQPSAQREGFATVPDVTWADVGALSAVRQELNLAILAPIRFADHYEALGMSSPSGVLLCGPPGCGKTLLAKAVANEAGINFISVKGPELLNMYVGESERAVRQVFQRAKGSVPCVIFFDELDALCPRRSDHSEGGASSRVVNQLLTEMDGLECRRGVFLMAASNRPDIIDPAVLRPGRLDKILHVGFPSAPDRVDILAALTKNGTKPRLADDAQLDRIGADEKLDGYTGADLASLVKEASTLALQEFVFGAMMEQDEGTKTALDGAQVSVHARHFEAAVDKIRPSVNEKVFLFLVRFLNLYFNIFIFTQDRQHYAAMMARQQQLK